MNNIISQVTPLTRGVLWFPGSNLVPDSDSYKALDYLLDGLITSSLNASESWDSRVIVGRSFNSSLYVLIVREFNNAEFDSFIRLIKPQLRSDNDLLVIDEAEVFQNIRTKVPKDISSQI
jgi:hypothetical protein